MRSIQEWLQETHSSGFELRRHFFLRFFDSELVSTPGQWKAVAGGSLAVLLSFSLPFAQAYYHKYGLLNGLPDAQPFRMAVIADILFLVSLSMTLMGLFTTLQWPSLFPGLRDYLALASLPVRMRDIFIAKFTALVAFGALFVIAIALLPSLVLPTVMAGAHSEHGLAQVPAIFAACSLAGLFVLFSLIALQGLLLNLLPVGQFARVSLAFQAFLLTALLCAFPFVLSIPDLQRFMNMRPAWAEWAPPIWFIGIQQVIAGSAEPFAVQMARSALLGVAGAFGAAVAAYLWSYRRHRVRVLESAGPEAAGRRDWFDIAATRFIPEPRELGVFAFISKGLARSRQHRLVLTAFAAIAVALIVESFVSLAFTGGFRGFSSSDSALRQAVISAPLALSLFVLSGFRYLFRLPIELRANWVFRVNEAGNRGHYVAGVQKFLLVCAVASVAIATLPLELLMLGPRAGIASAILCLMPSLILMEVLLMQLDSIPFTSSYLPGRRPVIQTVVLYGVAVFLYVSVFSGVVRWALESPAVAVALFGAMLVIWLRVRTGRVGDQEIGLLEFEELPEPAVHTLGIDRD